MFFKWETDKYVSIFAQEKAAFESAKKVLKANGITNRLTWNDIYQMVNLKTFTDFSAQYDLDLTGYGVLNNHVIGGKKSDGQPKDDRFKLMFDQTKNYITVDPRTGKCDKTCFGQYFFGKVIESCKTKYADCVLGFSFLGVESNSGSTQYCKAPSAAEMFVKKQGHVISGVNEFALLVDKVLADKFPGVTTTLAAVQAEYNKRYLDADVKANVFGGVEANYWKWYTTAFFVAGMMVNQDEMFDALKKLVAVGDRKFLPAGNWKAGLEKDDTDMSNKKLVIPLQPSPCALGFLVYHMSNALGISFKRDDARKTDWSNGRAWTLGFFFQQRLLAKGATVVGTAGSVAFTKCEIADKNAWLTAFNVDSLLLEEELDSI